LITRNGRNQKMQSLRRFVSWCQGVCLSHTTALRYVQYDTG
jgi:hypothetical protein